MELKYKDYVIEYINTFKMNEPIYLENIRKYVIENIKRIKEDDYDKIYKNINVIINRLNKENYIKTFTKSIYYKPIKNVFGEMPLDKSKIIKKKYLKDEDGNVNGYIAGEKLYYQLGLTTQIPNMTTIVTNNCDNKYDYIVKSLNIIIRKSVIDINRFNYKYLQLIDILSNIEKINIDNNNYEKVLYEFIKKNKLSYEKILKYIRETNNKRCLDTLLKIAK